MSASLADVLHFWFETCSAKDWFAKSDQLDNTIRERFGDLHSAIASGERDGQIKDGESALAHVIVLDQFSRNIYRDRPEAFAQDDKALAIARHAIAQGWDKNLLPDQRLFLYMPYMHSEDLTVHEQAEALFVDLGRPKNLEFELKHKAIIERFGRYPHRNAILGRTSTEEELAFLQQPGSSF